MLSISRARASWLGILAVASLLTAALSIPAAHTSAQDDIVGLIESHIQDAGSYRFTADVRQTLSPRPLPGMIGESSQQVDLRLSGEVQLPDRARMQLTIETNGAIAPTVELFQSGQQTFVRDGDGWVSLPAGTSTSAQASGYLGFLTGAGELRPANDDAQSNDSLAHYAFDLDGRQLAEALGGDALAVLGAQLPSSAGMSLSSSMAGIRGNGELWVDDLGLPQRMTIALENPGASGAYDALTEIDIEYTDFGQVTAMTGPVQGADGAWTSGQITATSSSAPSSANALLPSKSMTLPMQVSRSALAVFLCCLVFAAGIVSYRRHRQQAYAFVAIAVVICFVASPLLEAMQVVRLVDRRAEALALLTGQAGANTNDAAKDSLQSALSQSRRANERTLSAQSEPESKCGDGDAGVDSDNDGLNDKTEYCLGTDPLAEDSDHDVITDTLEIDGFDLGGHTWYGDPFSNDSNRDGMSDFAEWPEPAGAAPHRDGVDDWDPDGDGVPNLWDEDNDGDLLPDNQDLSPFSRTAYSDTFSLSTQGHGFDGYLYIELQIQPENMDHLRYAGTALDWPYDDLGQLQDLNDSAEDLRLTPMLKLRTNQPPDRELARQYGVSFFENGDEYDLYASLMPVTSGGRIVAFYAKVAYGPQEMDDIRWEDARLVWAVDMQLDQTVRGSIVTTPTPLHTYVEESIRITGLQVTKSKDVRFGLFGTPGTPEDDRYLFNVLLGLGSSYLSHQNPTLETLAQRFSSPNTPITQTWGVTSTMVAVDLPSTPYSHIDEGLSDLSTRVNAFLDDNGYPQNAQPTLVIATQQAMGSYTLDEGSTFQPDPIVHVNLAEVTMTTQRGLVAGGYRYDGVWQSMTTEDALQSIIARYDEAALSSALAALQDDYPDLTADDLENVLLMYYTAWLVGQTRFLDVDDRPTLPQSVADADLFAQFGASTESLPAYLITSLQLGAASGGLKFDADLTSFYGYWRENPDLARNSGLADTVRDIFSVSYAEASDAKINMITTGAIIGTKTLFAMNQCLFVLREFDNIVKLKGVTPVFAAMSKSGQLLSDLGWAASVAMIWVGYGLGTDWSDPLAKKQAIVQGVTATALTTAIYILSLMPGTFFLGLAFGLLDLFVLLSTGGMTTLTQEIIHAIYHVDILTYLMSSDFLDPDASPIDTDSGLVAGYRFRITAEYMGTIASTSEGDDDDVSGSLSYAYGKYDGSQTQGAVAVNENQSVHCGWEEPYGYAYWVCRNDVGVEYRLTTPGRNIELVYKPSITSSYYYQECTLGHCERKRRFSYLPDDLPSYQQWDTSSVYVDVLPTSIEAFWTWDALDNHDIDGDGLTNEEETNLGLDTTKWDTDGDGLSDAYEVEMGASLGTDPLKKDTDGDGLMDSLEIRVGARADAADSDNDGLGDDVEVFHKDLLDQDEDSDTAEWLGGWQVELPERSTSVWVISDPNLADADDDSQNDATERSNGTAPNGANAGPRLNLHGEPTTTSPRGTAAVYVKAGDQVALSLDLENISVDPVTSTLTLCLPDFLTISQGGSLEGDRTPPADSPDPTLCTNGFAWSFGGAYALHTWESARTSITTTVNIGSGPSTSGAVTAILPYAGTGGTDRITSTVKVVVDADAPEIDFMAPYDGLLLGGGISEYVVGGSSSDASTWVTQVDVNLPGAGVVSAEGVDPWAYTWHVPSDGVYSLSATATDYLGHVSAADSINNVMVDNTTPTVNMDLPDRSFVSGELEGSTITVTLTGTANDNLSGLARVQLSTDGRPWREIWFDTGHPLSTGWTAEWTLPNDDSAQGEHSVAIRAMDAATNQSYTLERTIIVDVVAPTDDLADRSFASDPPPYVASGQPLTLRGSANDAGNVPAIARPKDLVGSLDAADSSTIWLGLSPLKENDSGIHVAWLGDFNGDRLADMAIGFPAAAGRAGRITIIAGRAGGWPVPPDAEDLAEAGTSFVGKSNAAIGAQMGPAGDVNCDGYDDIIVGDATNSRVFVIFGSPTTPGQNLVLDGTLGAQWTEVSAPSGETIGQFVGAAGDANGDGCGDLLIGATGAVGEAYLLLGRADPWPQSISVYEIAAARIATSAGGARLTGVGDVDADEYDDFVIADGTTIHLFTGRDSFADGDGQPGEMLSLGDGVASFGSSDSLPSVVALGDVNADGRADFIYHNGSSPALVFGSSNHDWDSHHFDNFSPAASGFVAAAGDVDADGRDDVLLGNAAGDAYLIHGSDLGRVHATLTGVESAASAPYAAGSDLNADGSSDLLVVPNRDTSGATALADVDFGEMPFVDPASLPRRAPAVEVELDHASYLPLLAHGLSAYRASANTVAAPLDINGLPAETMPEATTRYVNDDAGCRESSPCYSTIQEAVDASVSGDTIEIQPGAYAPFTIDGKNDLTVRGVHADAVFIDGSGGGFAAKIAHATGVRLDKLTLRDADSAIYLEEAGIGGYDNSALRTTLDQLLVYDFAAHAISMDRTSTLSAIRSTLVGGDDHIGVRGSADSSLAAEWTTVEVDERATTEEPGGIVAAGGKVHVLHGRGSDTIDVYDPVAATWTSLTEPTEGVSFAAAADENDHLWSLRADPLGDFDGTVYAMAYVSSTLIYAGGDFHNAGGLPVDYLAQWDGERWNTVGSPANRPTGVVYALTVHNGDLYAGGDFGVRYMHGATWYDWGSTDGTGNVYAIAVDDTHGAYAGGSFTQIGGLSVKKIARRGLDGTWYRIGGGAGYDGIAGTADDLITSAYCNGVGYDASHEVRAMIIKPDGNLFVAGKFSTVAAGEHGSTCGVWGYSNIVAVDLSSPDGGWFTWAGDEGDLNPYGDKVYALALAGGDLLLAGDIDCVDWNFDTDSCDRAAEELAILQHGQPWVLPSTLQANDTVQTVAVDGATLVIGGAFTQVGGGVSASRIASYDNFPNDGGAWYEPGGGANDTVYSIAHDTGSIVAAGAFTQMGALPAFRLSRWDGSSWDGQSLYEYDGTWHDRSALAAHLSAGAALASDGAGRLYATTGGGTTAFYAYDIASGSWSQKSDLPGVVDAGTALAASGSYIYALRGGGSTDLCRFSPGGNSWNCSLQDTPITIGAGGGLVAVGSEWLYVLAGGNGTSLLRYHVPTDGWQTLSSALDTVTTGGGLVRVDRELYAVPGDGRGVLWQYGPVGVFPDKLNLDHVAFVIPETAAAATWLSVEGVDPYELQRQPDDFSIAGVGNTWVSNAGSNWTPDFDAGTTLSDNVRVASDQAAFLDADHNVYRLTAASILDAGYTVYQSDASYENGPGAAFTSLQGAINSGANWVRLKPGLYDENFYLLNGVNVIGSGADQTIIQPPASASDPSEGALVSAEGVVGASLSGLTLNGDDRGGVSFLAEGGAESVKLSRLVIRGADTGLRVHGGDTHVEIANNTIAENGTGMLADDCAAVDVRNTIFAYNDGAGLSYQGCAPIQLHAYNLYWDNGVDLSPLEPGAAELFLDPLFVDAASNDYRTLDASPVVDAGDPLDPTPPGTGQRVDIGYLEQGRASYYVDDDYCETCLNDGLAWFIDAFPTILDARNRAASDVAAVCTGEVCDPRTIGVGPGTYLETVEVPGYIRLIGSDPEQVTVDANGAAHAVVLDDVSHAEVRGLTVTGATTAGVAVTGASHHITVTRNIVRDSTGYGVLFSGMATGDVEFNTISENQGGGITVSDSGSWATVLNNILIDNDDHTASECLNDGVNLRTSSGGQIFNDYNDLWVSVCYTQNYAFDDGREAEGVHDIFDWPEFSDGFRLGSRSKAIDAASPAAPVPAGGGERADLGYWEYREPLAAQASLLLGREDVSAATGNSGVRQVEIGVVPVGDPGLAVTETLPAAWSSVTLDSLDQAVTSWMTGFVPSGSGLYRFYSRATDVVGNQEDDESDWYEGAFVADSTIPVVTWLSPAGGATTTAPLELLAEVSDYDGGDFTVKNIAFQLDGNAVAASWIAEPFDASDGQPRRFHAWVTPSTGSHTVYALAHDEAGNLGQTSPASFFVTAQTPADTQEPIVAIASPSEGQLITQDVTFAGTAQDLGSGLSSVEVSLDGGITWSPAAVSGTAWSLAWSAPSAEDYVTYVVRVRARDRAGNTATQVRTLVVDNVPPHRLTPVTFSFPEGSHFDLPIPLDIGWETPLDGSNQTAVLLTVDQNAESTPLVPVTGNSASQLLSTDGEWYVHLAVRDAAGNQFIRHYGPWQVGTFAYLAKLFQQRTQTIEVDGNLDFEHYEWLDTELLGTDAQPARGKQQFYATWEGTAYYLGWQGAWWDADGDMWAFVDIASGGDWQPDILPQTYSLPFSADYAVQVTGALTGTLWTYSAGSWQPSALTFANGESGGTEIRWPLPLGSGAVNVKLLAFALDDDGTCWSVFPTSNHRTIYRHRFSDAYDWEDLTSIDDIRSNQPVGASVWMDLFSNQDPDALWGPDSLLTFDIDVTNLESLLLAGLQLQITTTQGLALSGVEGAGCSDCGDPSSWLLDIGSMGAGVAQPITVTSLLASDLSSLAAVTTTVSLNLGPLTLLQTEIVHQIDNLPPEIQILTAAGNAIGTGAQTIVGTASDGEGGGVAIVEYSVDGGSTWSDASGLLNWQATFDVPEGATTVEFRVRVTDVFGQLTERLLNMDVDSTAPGITMFVPPLMAGNTGGITGTANDTQTEVTSVEVQVDDEDAAWRPAQVFSSTEGPQSWNFTWSLPSADGETHRFRARAQDAAGNISATTEWQSTLVDNKGPLVTTVQQIDAAIPSDYLVGGPGETVLRGTVSDGSGNAAVQVRVVSPSGAEELQPASLYGENWQFKPTLYSSSPGDYTFAVEAHDAAGNTTVEENVTFRVCGTIGCVIDATTQGRTAYVPAGTYAETVSLAKDITVTLRSNVEVRGSIAQSTGLLIAPHGTLTVTGDLEITGGAITPDAGTVVFGGGGTQTLTAGIPVTLHNMTIAAGTLLIQAGASSNLAIDGRLTNQGVLQYAQNVSDTGSLEFGLTGVSIAVQSQGTLTHLTVQRHDSDHPNATPGEQYGMYWNIAPTGGGYSVDLVLPHTYLIEPQVCKYDGGAWNCAFDGRDTETVTRLGIGELSDWAVGAIGWNAMAPEVDVDASGADVNLSWVHYRGDSGGYVASWYTDPYFMPGAAGVFSTTLPAPTESFTHTGVFGGSANYFYVVQGVNESEDLSSPSNRTGVFTFELAPGAP